MTVPMTAKDLYEEIKEALHQFGLSFYEMDQMQVSIDTSGPEPLIVFTTTKDRKIEIKTHY